jgi:hypothetical protein
MKSLEYAIEDAKRFISRTEGYLAVVKAGGLTEADLKLIRRHSLDVTRSMKELREDIEATPAPAKID